MQQSMRGERVPSNQDLSASCKMAHPQKSLHPIGLHQIGSLHPIGSAHQGRSSCRVWVQVWDAPATGIQKGLLLPSTALL